MKKFISLVLFALVVSTLIGCEWTDRQLGRRSADQKATDQVQQWVSQKQEMLVGTWRADDQVVVLSADGTFTATRETAISTGKWWVSAIRGNGDWAYSLNLQVTEGKVQKFKELGEITQAIALVDNQGKRVVWTRD